VRGQLRLRRGQPAEDLFGPVGQQAAGVGEPDAPAGALHQSAAGLGLEPGEVVADGRLGVVQGPGRRGHRAVPGNRDQHLEPGDVEHPANLSI